MLHDGTTRDGTPGNGTLGNGTPADGKPADGTPATDEIRRAIEARIDRTMALEELGWRLHSFIEDLWGPLPEAWSTGMADLGVELSRDGASRIGDGSRVWESRRTEILDGLSAHEAWLVGLSERLWEHAFDRARESIRSVAIESFLDATLAYVAEYPDVPPVRAPVAADTETATTDGATVTGLS